MINIRNKHAKLGVIFYTNPFGWRIPLSIFGPNTTNEPLRRYTYHENYQGLILTTGIAVDKARLQDINPATWEQEWDVLVVADGADPSWLEYNPAQRFDDWRTEFVERIMEIKKRSGKVKVQALRFS